MPAENPIRRPRSLAEVASWSDSLEQFGLNIKDFLHHFQDKRDPASLTEEPRLLAPLFNQGDVADAYLAAIASELASELGPVVPLWCRKPERYLHQPWFATPGRHMRALLLLESPPGFRERNLFVSANALSVA